ncbi:MAG: LysE family transporter [Acidobacteriota bacterium]
MSFLPAIKGFVLMLSSIVAIGPQNALLLRQAVRREQAWLTAGIFLVGDVTMVLLGGFGIGRFLGRWPLVKLLLTALGAVYILWFGVGVFRQMLHPKSLAVNAASGGERSVVLGALAVTFLNPHAIFDTVILVGTVALQFQGSTKIIFMLGAILGSTTWFFGVAWAGQRLAPFLSRPDVWRVIDGAIVVIMFLMSTMLAVDAWRQWQSLT